MQNTRQVMSPWAAHHGAHGAQAWQKWWWQCGACQGWNQCAVKTCRTCGIKKSRAQSVSPQGAPAPAAAGQLVGQAPEPFHTQSVDKDRAIERAAHIGKIRHLESALAALPEADASLAPARSALETQLTTEKKAVTATRSVASQIEGCEQAVERARGRLSRHRQALADASAGIAKEEAAMREMEGGLVKLRSQMAVTVSTPVDSIQAASAALNSLLGDMQSSSVVPPAHVQQAQQQVALLLEGVQKIAAAAQGASAAQGNGPKWVGDGSVRLHNRSEAAGGCSPSGARPSGEPSPSAHKDCSGARPAVRCRQLAGSRPGGSPSRGGGPWRGATAAQTLTSIAREGGGRGYADNEPPAGEGRRPPCCGRPAAATLALAFKGHILILSGGRRSLSDSGRFRDADASHIKGTNNTPSAYCAGIGTQVALPGFVGAYCA
ncbi:unnamed protein product [Prorocentrum cordatum]|uniref:RanBP2-type domain-containing protein n=1 Tax=Prorocentrum cordatum TaxID=2364126 RepID=A0ABN9PT89_9DINO|nr:unnamed protein product [Polarella glacialis]